MPRVSELAERQTTKFQFAVRHVLNQCGHAKSRETADSNKDGLKGEHRTLPSIIHVE
jgi:hypothetical protein